MIAKMKEPVSSLTHMLFAIMAIPMTLVLVYLSAKQNSVTQIAAFSIFGASMFSLYTASTIYHALPVKKSVEILLKKIDHMMIFVLIAGTYTPICLIVLKGAWGISILAVIWALAAAGIVMKALWINAPRWVGTLIYVIMGWLVIIAFYPLYKNVDLLGIAFLVAGGLSYTVGALIYALKRPKLNFKFFGFHEIFHIFVMLGTTFHVLFMFFWVL